MDPSLGDPFSRLFFRNQRQKDYEVRFRFRDTVQKKWPPMKREWESGTLASWQPGDIELQFWIANDKLDSKYGLGSSGDLLPGRIERQLETKNPIEQCIINISFLVFSNHALDRQLLSYNFL